MRSRSINIGCVKHVLYRFRSASALEYKITSSGNFVERRRVVDRRAHTELQEIYVLAAPTACSVHSCLFVVKPVKLRQYHLFSLFVCTRHNMPGRRLAQRVIVDSWRRMVVVVLGPSTTTEQKRAGNERSETHYLPPESMALIATMSDGSISSPGPVTGPMSTGPSPRFLADFAGFFSGFSFFVATGFTGVYCS